MIRLTPHTCHSVLPPTFVVGCFAILFYFHQEDAFLAVVVSVVAAAFRCNLADMSCMDVTAASSRNKDDMNLIRELYQ